MIDEFEINKKFNEIIKKSHENSKLDYCVCCGDKLSSFCNSHSLPEFVLKNISDNGMVYNSNKFFGAPLIKDTKGLNNSGTFKRICKKCDKEIFKDYEDISKIEQEPDDNIMAQIDLKNSLRMYDKRLNEIELYKIFMAMSLDNEMNYHMDEKQKVNDLDLNEIKEEINRDMKILNEKTTSNFELIYWKKLDYVTPIAFQGHVALHGDLKGKIINDI